MTRILPLTLQSPRRRRRIDPNPTPNPGDFAGLPAEESEEGEPSSRSDEEDGRRGSSSKRARRRAERRAAEQLHARLVAEGASALDGKTPCSLS